MSNTLIRDAVLICLIGAAGFYAFTERDKIYEFAGVNPQDIANARQNARNTKAATLTEQTTPQNKTTNGYSAFINKSPDGQFWTQAVVNDSNVRFLIDTGASVVVLTPADAQRAGLRPETLDYTAPVNTAAGQVYAALVELSNISVGDVTVYNVRAVVIPKGLTHSLLGMSFLGELQKLEVTSDELVLRQ